MSSDFANFPTNELENFYLERITKRKQLYLLTGMEFSETLRKKIFLK